MCKQTNKEVIHQRRNSDEDRWKTVAKGKQMKRRILLFLFALCKPNISSGMNITQKTVDLRLNSCCPHDCVESSIVTSTIQMNSLVKTVKHTEDILPF